MRSDALEAIKQRLEVANALLDEAHERSRRHFDSEALQSSMTAHEAVLAVEREFAAAKGEEYAIPSEFPVRWCVGAPSPQLVRDERTTLLAFLVAENRQWDGKTVEMVSSDDEVLREWALVEVKGCCAVKMGWPNDEVHAGHPLYGKGMASYSAQIVMNSRWQAEMLAINSVHHDTIRTPRTGSTTTTTSSGFTIRRLNAWQRDSRSRSIATRARGCWRG